MVSKLIVEDTALIIPVYNEEKVITGVIDDALSHFKYIVCVDDGSLDGSAGMIQKTNAYLVKHPINMGQGAALQTGIEFARQLPVSYFVTFDADGQHQVDDVLAMLTDIRRGDLDVILGSRFLGKTVGASRGKTAMLRLAVLFNNFTSGLKLTDAHNGLRVFNRRVAEEMQITMPDMSHASEITAIVRKKGYRYKELPVTIKYSDYSKSKGQSVINLVNIAFDTLLRRIVK